MGKNTKSCKAFIESISDSKLTGFPKNGGTIYKDRDFRLDMQGVCFPYFESVLLYTYDSNGSKHTQAC